MVKKITEAQIRIHLHTLIEAPQRILAYTDGMDDSRLNTPLATKEWSIAEILAHLRGASEVWTASIFAMLLLDRPELTYIHPRTWIKAQGYAALSFAENLAAFKVGHAALVHILEGLTFDDWGRSARFIGKVNIYTVFGETMRMALHDADHCNHLQQFASTINDG